MQKFLAIPKPDGPTRCFSWFKIQDIASAPCKPLLQKRSDQKLLYKLQGVLDCGKTISHYSPDPTIIWLLLSPQPGGQSWVSRTITFQRPFVKEIKELLLTISIRTSPLVLCSGYLTTTDN